MLANGASSAGGLLPADATDLRHVTAIGADRFAPFPTRRPGLVGRKFVRGSLLMCRFTPFLSDFSLSAAIHGGKSTISSISLHSYSLY
jgi:hypothetical protein